MAKTKAALLKPAETYHFDPKKKSHLFTDAPCRHGIGYALIQHDRDRPHLIQCGSRSLTSTEANYAIIELECLAITWAFKKCRIYLAGSNFNVYSDHKPLKQTFETKSLDHMEGSRVHRLIQTVYPYMFQFSYVPGKDHLTADTLSRALVFQPNSKEFIIMNSVRTAVLLLAQHKSSNLHFGRLMQGMPAVSTKHSYRPTNAIQRIIANGSCLSWLISNCRET